MVKHPHKMVIQVSKHLGQQEQTVIMNNQPSKIVVALRQIQPLMDHHLDLKAQDYYRLKPSLEK